MSAEIVNDLTGEMELRSADGATHGLLFDLRAMKELETQSRCSVGDLFEAWGTTGSRPGIDVLERLVIVGSKAWHRHNPNGEKPLNTNNALDAIEAAGKWGKVFLVVVKSLETAWGGTDTDDEDEAGDEGSGDDARPPGRGAAP